MNLVYAENSNYDPVLWKYLFLEVMICFNLMSSCKGTDILAKNMLNMKLIKAN